MDQDIEYNRGLCMRFLSQIEAALASAERLPHGAAMDDGMLLWLGQLFGGKDGLAGAYIRLSQQQLRIAALQRRCTPKEQEPPSEAALTQEDIALLQAWLSKCGAAPAP